MHTANHCRARGVTLIELLVVLMILSIILTAAVKTWDVTLERGRAQTTASKLNQLVSVIVGDPDYIVAGQRADFGFVGDEGRLPDSLAELVNRPPGDSVWRGPYIRSTFNQSSSGYKTDGWGDTIIYGREYYHYDESLFVRSYGGRGPADRSRWQTLNFPYTYAQLVSNTVTGHIVDVRGNEPPAWVPGPSRPDSIISGLSVRLYKPSAGKDTFEELTGTAAANFTFQSVPQGTHRLVAKFKNTWKLSPESSMVTQAVPVYPHVGARDIIMRVPWDWKDSLH
jgi:prepilin-type N-terminal cleavage/methylation domain-containing protein